jgi:prophage tail gpP-like protein
MSDAQAVDQVRLVVGGTVYTGWQSVSIKRSLNTPVDIFEVEVFDQWAGGSVRVRNGAPYQLYLDKTLISTGYLDKVSRHYDKKGRSVMVTGRSKTADLLDCSYPVHKLPASWQGLTVLQVCQTIAKPFGIAVTDVSGLAKQVLPYVRVQPGDKALDVIGMYLRGIGARAMSLPDGNLQIVGVGKQKLATPIALGQNVISCASEDNLQDRYSEYHVTSQSGRNNHQATADYQATRIDKVMQTLRYRPRTIHPRQMLMSQQEANNIARVACNHAAGESHTTTYSVHGWRHADGLWTPNTQVKVIDAEAGWNDWLMVGTVTLKLDDEGKLAHITVLPVTAYDITAEPQQPTGETL